MTLNVYSNECTKLSYSDCRKNDKCKISNWRCDYVPPGKTFEEVCPNGGKGWNCIEKKQTDAVEETK